MRKSVTWLAACASSAARRSASRARSRSRAISTRCQPRTPVAAGQHQHAERPPAVTDDAVPPDEAARRGSSPRRRLGPDRLAGDHAAHVVGELLDRVVAAIGLQLDRLQHDGVEIARQPAAQPLRRRLPPIGERVGGERAARRRQRPHHGLARPPIAAGRVRRRAARSRADGVRSAARRAARRASRRRCGCRRRCRCGRPAPGSCRPACRWPGRSSCVSSAAMVVGVVHHLGDAEVDDLGDRPAVDRRDEHVRRA